MNSEPKQPFLRCLPPWLPYLPTTLITEEARWTLVLDLAVYSSHVESGHQSSRDEAGSCRTRRHEEVLNSASPPCGDVHCGDTATPQRHPKAGCPRHWPFLSFSSTALPPRVLLYQRLHSGFFPRAHCLYRSSPSGIAGHAAPAPLLTPQRTGMALFPGGDQLLMVTLGHSQPGPAPLPSLQNRPCTPSTATQKAGDPASP